MKLSTTLAALTLATILTVSPSAAAVTKCNVTPKTPAPTNATLPTVTPAVTPMATPTPTLPADDDETGDEYDAPSPAPTKKTPKPTAKTVRPTAAPQPTRTTRPTAAPQATKTAKPTASPPAATTAKPAAAQNGVDPVTCLAAHNKLRTEVGVPPLTWDPALASKGAAWAQHMEDLNFFDHSTPGKSDAQMNNLYSGTDCLGAAAAFGSEKSKLPADRIVRLESYMQYGHYSMVVWRTTTRMGCGRGKTKNLACYYEQPGNMIGQAAY